MPRRSILSPAERDSLFSFPESRDEIIRHYTFNEAELSLIGQHRGAANRLGFAAQLSCMRYPGVIIAAGVEPPPTLLQYVAGQLNVDPALWREYARRDQTRREHLLELQVALNLRLLTVADYRPAILALVDPAMQTDKGLVLAQALIEYLRRLAILLPAANVIERICAEAVTCATRRIHDVLTEWLTDCLLPSIKWCPTSNAMD